MFAKLAFCTPRMPSHERLGTNGGTHAKNGKCLHLPVDAICLENFRGLQAKKDVAHSSMDFIEGMSFTFDKFRFFDKSSKIKILLM